MWVVCILVKDSLSVWLHDGLWSQGCLRCGCLEVETRRADNCRIVLSWLLSWLLGRLPLCAPLSECDADLALQRGDKENCESAQFEMFASHCFENEHAHGLLDGVAANEFCNSNAEVVVQDQNFATGNESPVDKDVDGVAG